MDMRPMTKCNEIAVTLKASSFCYDQDTDSYRIKFTESALISHDTLTKTIILQVPSSKVQTSSQTQQLKDEDIDSILDEIAAKETPKKPMKEDRIQTETPKKPRKGVKTSITTPRDDKKEEVLGPTPRKFSQKEQLAKKLASIPKPRKSSSKSPSRSPEPEQSKQVNAPSIANVNLEHTKLTRSMMREWTVCYGGSDEDCDGKNPAECSAMNRIKFILENYSYWMKHKSMNEMDEDSDCDFTLKDDSSDGDSSDGGDSVDVKSGSRERLLMRGYEWMSDFFSELGGYSYISLSDDFEHIRDHHMKLNKNKTTVTIDYLDGLLGKCTDKECSCLQRHCRDRRIDNVDEKKRREVFFIREEGEREKDSEKGKKHDAKTKKKKVVKKNTVRETRMYFEINLQTKLDTIHITLRHHHLRLINTDKFITKIYGSYGGESKAKLQKDDDRKEKDIFRKMTKYSFGESITYWDSKHHRYCDSKYADLRSELLNNTIYALSLDLYNTLKNRAISFLQTKKGVGLQALREHDWMKKWKILRESVITVDHIIALLCYVNVTALRRIFKLHGFVRRKNNLESSKKNKKKYESRDALLEKHREIWHWSRLLLECVHCYGVPLTAQLSYYHGIDCKLLFNRFNVMFDIPTSLTLNRDIAYNLSRTINHGRGIAIELSHGGLSDLQSLCLDLSFLSDYPSEEEQLVFHSYLSFNDVIINRMHHDEWLKILRFWYKIKEGFFFNHLIESTEITRNDQLCICAMIINMIIADEKHERYDNRIPQYMQYLFNECVENNTFVWIIQSEYGGMIKKLQSLLYFDYVSHTKSSQFIQYLMNKKKCNVCNANIFNWNISPSQFESLFSHTNEWIVSPQYTVFMNDCGNNYLKFHFEAQNKAKNNLFRCRIHLDDKPDFVAKINLGMGLFCKMAHNFDNYSYGELRWDKLYNVSLHSLFETKILKTGAKSKKRKEFDLKLQIQLFYVYDFNGKLIPINQSQSMIKNIKPKQLKIESKTSNLKNTKYFD